VGHTGKSRVVTALGLSLLLSAAMACGPRYASSIGNRADCQIFWSVAPLRADTMRDTEAGIAGSIVDAWSGELVEGARVRLTSISGVHDSVFSRDGRFEFVPLVAGTYVVRASRIGYHPRRDTLRLQSTEAIRVTLSMDQSPSDECHGLDLVTRKPWWKFW
jgi:hypothetical protein